MATQTTVGDRVKLKKDDNVGVVRFIGEIKGKKGIFYGVELDDAKGKNNGSVDKVKYFKCAAKKGLFVAKTGIAKTNPKANKDAPRVEIGDTVQCKAAKCKGKVRFMGTPYGVKDTGVFYGIELEKANGKNNGTAGGREFFKCKPKYGIFIQASGFTVAGAKKTTGKKKDAAAKKEKEPAAAEAPKEEEKQDEDYKEGDRVMLKPDKVGQIRWIGSDKDWPEGTWYGVRLTEDRGDCDGEWKEKRKFYCPEGYGVFVELRNIEKRADDDSIDFMQEDEQYKKELAEKAEVYKKEAGKLQTLQDKFKEVDTDGNKMVDRSEFNELASNVFGCTKRETNALFAEIDVNKSGSISFAEFDAWVKKLGGVEELNKLAEAQNDDDDKKEENAAADDAEAAKADDAAEEKPKDDAEPAKDDDAAQDAAKDDAEADPAKDEADAPKDDAEAAQDDAEPAKDDAEEAKNDAVDTDNAEAAKDDAAAADDAAPANDAGDEAAADDKPADDKPADAEANDAGDEAAADDKPADDKPADE